MSRNPIQALHAFLFLCFKRGSRNKNLSFVIKVFLCGLITLPIFAHAQTTLNSAATINISMTEGQSFSQTFNGTGTIDNTYTLNGTAPAGISISTINAPPPSTSGHHMVLSGTPTAAGTYTFNIDVFASNFSATVSYSTTLVVTVAAGAPDANNVTQSVLQNSSNNSIATSTSGDVSSVNITSGPSHGTASINGTTIRYTPATNYFGTDSINYTATGPGGTSAVATISLTVAAVAPSLTSSTTNIDANGTSTTLIPSITGTATSITIRQTPSHGTASVNGLNIIYTPTAGYIGTDTITLFASGPGGVSNTGTLTLNVVARAPSIATSNTNVDGNTTGNLITPSISGIANTLNIVASPSHGTAVVNGMSISYTPNANYAGTDSISVTATGPGGTSSATTLAITVNLPAPVITPVSTAVIANSANNTIRPPITGIVNTLTITAPPAHGSAAVNGLDIVYVPVVGYVGTDSIGVTAFGPGGVSTAATLSITVTAPPPVITATNISVNANSSANVITPSVSGLVSSLTISGNPGHGTVSVNGLTLIYTPTSGFVGSDSISVAANGLSGSSSPAVINIDVRPVTVNPLSLVVQANSQTNAVNLPALAGATSLTITTTPIHGSANVNGIGLSYTPSTNFVGNDSLRVSAVGSNGVFASFDVSIAVTAAAPVASKASLSVESGRTATIDLSRYVTGPTFTGISLALASTPLHGTVSISGSNLSYTASPNYSGNDSLMFIAKAVGGSSLPTELAITVTARPDPSIDRSVVGVHNATTAVVRHFEQVQIDQFNGRLLEIASQSRSTTKSDEAGNNKTCGQIGAWVSGLNSYGSYRGRDGSKYTTMGYSAGADRCFGSSSTTIGIGLGYARDHNELAQAGVNMTASANTIASYISTQLIPAMRLSFVAGANRIGNRYQRYESNSGSLAYGEWNGTQAFSSSSVSGDLDVAMIKFSPFVKMDLSNLSLDPYTESGATPYLLHYHQQSMRSQRSTVGFNSEMTIETPWGKLIPRLRMEVQKDTAKRNSLKINYVDFPDAVYLIPTNELDRRITLIAFGADMNWNNGIVTILNITRSSANQNNQSNRINLRFSYNY
ncbi:tandem-95 repeat protein [Undibacterium sp. LX40W]|uniref:Tandem-95 repeat protein n=1 Tax=Undibacterium nitidum TaxID=2762298 RepID=A0A923HNM6_9BURK|nr:MULTISPECIES: Ig-like domain-containing protein [Undibacterium]MBC3882372.1 tandem-95 repeat protein [Undibacterium nitidum]MBC3892653.1 tandem-95 repeat protein [Undibacterium sp. LX40W]